MTQIELPIAAQVTYRVSLEEDGETFFVDCPADSEDDALDKASKAYPTASVMSAWVKD